MESIGFSTSDLLGLKCCCSNSDGCSNVLSFGFSRPNKSRRPFCRSQKSLRPPFFFCRSDNCYRCTFGITSNVVCNKEAIESFRIKCICLGQRVKLSNTTQKRPSHDDNYHMGENPKQRNNVRRNHALCK